MGNEMFTEAKELAKYLVEQGRKQVLAEDEKSQKIIDIDGVKFKWNSRCEEWEPIIIPIPEDEPHPAAWEFYTLDGMIDYIKENTEGLIPAKGSKERLILQVANWNSVFLMSQPSEHNKSRHTIAKVKAHTPEICFDRHMDNEEFCTMLLSKFIDTPARADLFKVVKNLTNEQSLRTSDDGVSQVVTVKQGVSLAADVKFENPVPLKPMRTFTEVDQPESNFTLRIDEKARPALFEADGGAWKNEAVALIKEYLKHNLIGYNVVVLA